MTTQKKDACEKGTFTFLSNNGFQTKVWGPLLWVVLHIITLNYPNNPTDNDKKQYKRFFVSLGNVLPCKTCRESYKHFIREHPKTKLKWSHFRNRCAISKWLFVLHNEVNKKIHKTPKKGFLKMMQFYEQFRANCHQSKRVGCIHPAKGPRRRSIVKVMPLTHCKKKRSVTCSNKK